MNSWRALNKKTRISLCWPSGFQYHELVGNNIKFLFWSEYVQTAVYKLSETGQAIDAGDYSKATAVFAQQNGDWVRNIQAAIDKVFHFS